MTKETTLQDQEDFLSSIWEDGVMSVEEREAYNRRYQDAVVNSDISLLQMEAQARKAQVAALADLIKDASGDELQVHDGNALEIMSGSEKIIIVSRKLGRYYLHAPEKRDGITFSSLIPTSAQLIPSDEKEGWIRVCLDEINDLRLIAGFILGLRGSAPKKAVVPDDKSKPEKIESESEVTDSDIDKKHINDTVEEDSDDQKAGKLSDDEATREVAEEAEISSKVPGGPLPSEPISLSVMSEDEFKEAAKMAFEDGVLEDHELLFLDQTRSRLGIDRIRAFMLMQKEAFRRLTGIIRNSHPEFKPSRKVDPSRSTVLYTFKDEENSIRLMVRMTMDAVEIYIALSEGVNPPEETGLKPVKVKSGDVGSGRSLWGGRIGSIRDLHQLADLLKL